MTSYLNNGYDVMKYFAKFEKFIPHSIIIPSFMTTGSQMPELDRGAFLPPPPPYKIGNQNIPYKLGLKTKQSIEQLLLSVIFSIYKYSVEILKLTSVSIIFSFIHERKCLLFNG